MFTQFMKVFMIDFMFKIIKNQGNQGNGPISNCLQKNNELYGPYNNYYFNQSLELTSQRQDTLIYNKIYLKILVDESEIKRQISFIKIKIIYQNRINYQPEMVVMYPIPNQIVKNNQNYINFYPAHQGLFV